MTIPTASNYPESFDSDDNLFLVHDSLRVRLSEDYEPGDTSIFIEGNEEIISRFPPTGLITLTEQCSDIEERAISFYYASRTATSFDGLEILPGFTDVAKPKRITNVTQNVMAQHHNALKDALIAVQTFIGIQGTVDAEPLGDTLVGRFNFLKRLVLTPRAWFTVDKRIGLVPLCVTFEDKSFRLGDGDVVYIWDFGDNSNSTISVESQSVISLTSTVPSTISQLVQDTDGGTITKCYYTPGIYDVTLTVRNEYGEDIVRFDNLINARVEAPEEAIIDLLPTSTQDLTAGDPVGGPYTTPPKIRSLNNTFVSMEIADGENPATPGYSYGGELLDGSGSPIDPIVEYTWNLGDDLDHANLSAARASYTLGGVYDIQLRVDTKYGSYRITTYEDAIDIIESENLWLWTFTSQDSGDGGVVKAHEFGLLSETFKTANTSLSVERDNSFLDYLAGAEYDEEAETRAKNEFSRNTLFTAKGTTSSGNHGDALIFWAGGGDPIEDQEILVRQYNGFNDTYSTQSSFARPWNWVGFSSGTTAYFLLGQSLVTADDTNPAHDERTDYNLQTLSASTVTITADDFSNGADELLLHPSVYDEDGVATNGYFAVYRSTWKDSTGYILRNSGVNEFFRLADFYKTEGTIADPFITMTKLPDIGGSAKTEGQLVPMYNGIFFFNNSGEMAAWNDTSGTWEVGRASGSSVSFRSLQVTTVSGFDNKANTLIAVSNNDRIAYLSYDYSTSAFIKFNGADQTFTSAGSRPTGTQFLMGIY